MKKTILAILIALAFVLSACSSSENSSNQENQNVPVTGNEAKVTISNFAFDPATITVKAGQTVVWTNEDVTPHTVVADDNSFQSPSIAKGQTFTHTFTTAGTFSYHCSIHPKMKAQVVVTP